MHAWEAIQKAVDYMEAHPQESIKAEALAEMVGLSPFYFQRLFKRLVNKPPQEYVKLRRLARAVEALSSGHGRILDAALDCGFAGHANLTRAFKAAFGITPEEYRKNRPPLNTFLKPELSMGYVMVDEGIPLIVGGIVLEIRREQLTAPEAYLGLAADVSIEAQTPLGERTGIDTPGLLWKRFHEEKAKMEGYMQPEIELGLSGSADAGAGTFSYFAGGLAKAVPESLASGFVKRELPAGEYVVCAIEAERFEELVTKALDQAGKYLFGTWLPKHGLATLPFSAEKYDRTSQEARRMEIWVSPIPAAM